MKLNTTLSYLVDVVVAVVAVAVVWVGDGSHWPYHPQDSWAPYLHYQSKDDQGTRSLQERKYSTKIKQKTLPAFAKKSSNKSETPIS